MQKITAGRGLPSEAATAHQEGLAKEDGASNAQHIGGAHPEANTATLSTDAAGKNEQKIPGTQTPNNTQALPAKSVEANRAAVDVPPNADPNHQPLDAEAASLNRQAAPTDAPPGPNHQGVDKENIEDHYEPLKAPAGSAVTEKSRC